MSGVQLKINGRKKWFYRISGINKVSAGRYEITTHIHGTFTVEGGKRLGGRRNEWFLECAKWDKPIVCSSIIDACQVIENM